MNILDFIDPMRKNRTLIGKPKVKISFQFSANQNAFQLFFVQACRGHDYMEGWRGRAGAQVTHEPKPFRTPRTWPVDADVLIHYATTGSLFYNNLFFKPVNFRRSSFVAEPDKRKLVHFDALRLSEIRLLRR